MLDADGGPTLKQAWAHVLCLLGTCLYPANIRRWANVDLLLAHLLRRWPNRKSTLVHVCWVLGTHLIVYYVI